MRPPSLMHSQTPPVIGYKNVSDRFVKSMSVDRPDPTGGRGRNMEVIEHWDSLYQNLASQGKLMQALECLALSTETKNQLFGPTSEPVRRGLWDMVTIYDHLASIAMDDESEEYVASDDAIRAVILSEIEINTPLGASLLSMVCARNTAADGLGSPFITSEGRITGMGLTKGSQSVVDLGHELKAVVSYGIASPDSELTHAAQSVCGLCRGEDAIHYWGMATALLLKPALVESINFAIAESGGGGKSGGGFKTAYKAQGISIHERLISLCRLKASKADKDKDAAAAISAAATAAARELVRDASKGSISGAKRRQQRNKSGLSGKHAASTGSLGQLTAPAGGGGGGAAAAAKPTPAQRRASASLAAVVKEAQRTQAQVLLHVDRWANFCVVACTDAGCLPVEQQLALCACLSTYGRHSEARDAATSALAMSKANIRHYCKLFRRASRAGVGHLSPHRVEQVMLQVNETNGTADDEEGEGADDSSAERTGGDEDGGVDMLAMTEAWCRAAINLPTQHKFCALAQYNIAVESEYLALARQAAGHDVGGAGGLEALAWYQSAANFITAAVADAAEMTSARSQSSENHAFVDHSEPGLYDDDDDGDGDGDGDGDRAIGATTMTTAGRALEPLKRQMVQAYDDAQSRYASQAFPSSSPAMSPLTMPTQSTQGSTYGEGGTRTGPAAGAGPAGSSFVFNMNHPPSSGTGRSSSLSFSSRPTTAGGGGGGGGSGTLLSPSRINNYDSRETHLSHQQQQAGRPLSSPGRRSATRLQAESSSRLSQYAQRPELIPKLNLHPLNLMAQANRGVPLSLNNRQGIAASSGGGFSGGGIGDGLFSSEAGSRAGSPGGAMGRMDAAFGAGGLGDFSSLLLYSHQGDHGVGGFRVDLTTTSPPASSTGALGGRGQGDSGAVAGKRLGKAFSSGGLHPHAHAYEHAHHAILNRNNRESLLRKHVSEKSTQGGHGAKGVAAAVANSRGGAAGLAWGGTSDWARVAQREDEDVFTHQHLRHRQAGRALWDDLEQSYSAAADDASALPPAPQHRLFRQGEDGAGLTMMVGTPHPLGGDRAAQQQHQHRALQEQLQFREATVNGMNPTLSRAIQTLPDGHLVWPSDESTTGLATTVRHHHRHENNSFNGTGVSSGASPYFKQPLVGGGGGGGGGGKSRGSPTRRASRGGPEAASASPGGAPSALGSLSLSGRYNRSTPLQPSKKPPTAAIDHASSWHGAAGLPPQRQAQMNDASFAGRGLRPALGGRKNPKLAASRRAVLLKIFDIVDTDRDGQINQMAFMSAMTKDPRLPRALLTSMGVVQVARVGNALFQHADSDRDGSISSHGFVRFFADVAGLERVAAQEASVTSAGLSAAFPFASHSGFEPDVSVASASGAGDLSGGGGGGLNESNVSASLMNLSAAEFNSSVLDESMDVLNAHDYQLHHGGGAGSNIAVSSGGAAGTSSVVAGGSSVVSRLRKQIALAPPVAPPRFTDEDKDDCALLIQRHYRGHAARISFSREQSRQAYLEQMDAATNIQTLFRGHSRRSLNRSDASSSSESGTRAVGRGRTGGFRSTPEDSASATLIQSVWRGHKGRERVRKEVAPSKRADVEEAAAEIIQGGAKVFLRNGASKKEQQLRSSPPAQDKASVPGDGEGKGKGKGGLAGEHASVLQGLTRSKVLMSEDGSSVSSASDDAVAEQAEQVAVTASTEAPTAAIPMSAEAALAESIIVQSASVRRSLLSDNFISSIFGLAFDLTLLSRLTSDQVLGKDADDFSQLRDEWKGGVISDKHSTPSLTLIDAQGDDGNTIVLALLTTVPWAHSDGGKAVADASALVGLFTASPDSQLEVLEIRQGQNANGQDFHQAVICRSADWGPCLGESEGVIVWDGLQSNASYCKLGSDLSTFEKPDAAGKHSFLLSDDSEWYFSVIALETWSITASEGTSVAPEDGLNLDSGFHAAAKEAAKVEAQ